ncbi:zona pellucida sperm-binding protein 3-like [Polymixia lowei]
METFVVFSVNLLVGLHLSGFCITSSFAFPSKHGTQLFEGPQFGGQRSKQALHEKQSSTGKQAQVNTVAVTCHPDFMEIVIKADMFEVGAPIDPRELCLGVEHSDYCTAVASSDDEYRITVGLSDCGTKHWMTEDSLIYTNLLLYSPVASPEGVIRMDEAVVPIECHYERKYSLSSSSLTPTWIPFTSTQAAVETLDFDMRILTSDLLYERSSNVFYLGEPIFIEASVRVGHHTGLRVFVSSCVATLDPEMDSNPRYVFIENDGCLVDSQLQGARSRFLRRTQDDKLLFVIDAFKFHEEERRQIYLTCRLNAVPVTNDAAPQNKACTFINGRWRSADGSDFLCVYCQGQNEVGQSQSIPSNYGNVGPRSYNRPEVPEAFQRSGLNANVWEQETRMVPIVVLPGRTKSGPIPAEDLPPFLSAISRPAQYGSHWRSGVHFKTDLEKGLVPDHLLVPTPEASTLEDLTTKMVTVTSGSERKGDPSDLGKGGTDFKDGGNDGATAEKDVTAVSNATLAVKPMATLDVPSHEADDHTPGTHSHTGPIAPAQEDHNAELAVTTSSKEPATESILSDFPKK